MRITITVMAHPKRKAQAEALALQLKQYPFMDVSITWDEVNEEWDTGKHAMWRGTGRGDWHVIIQDDAILTPHFYENVLGAINAMPERSLISLYTGTARPIPDRVKSAVDKAPDGSWLRFHQLLWGVGIAIPTDQIEPMLEFVDDVNLPYDNRIGEFYCRNGVTVYYTVPSLVDHDDDLDTLLEGHGRHVSPEPRRAHRLASKLIHWTNQKAPI
jgi:hypothetical protein